MRYRAGLAYGIVTGGSRPRAGLSRRVVGWCRCDVRETTERVPQFSSPTRRVRARSSVRSRRETEPARRRQRRHTSAHHGGLAAVAEAKSETTNTVSTGHTTRLVLLTRARRSSIHPIPRSEKNSERVDLLIAVVAVGRHCVVVIIVEIVIEIACVVLAVLFRSVSAACPARVPFQSSTQHATDLEARSLYVRYRTITIGTMTTTIRHAPQLFLPSRPFFLSSLTN